MARGIVCCFLVKIFIFNTNLCETRSVKYKMAAHVIVYITRKLINVAEETGNLKVDIDFSIFINFSICFPAMFTGERNVLIDHVIPYPGL